ncbi:MAG: RDD family protein [Dermatophilaceae bacterium]
MAGQARRAEEHDGELRDAALGVAAVAGRAASDVVSAAGGAVRLVTANPLVGLVEAVTRPVVEPLADAGRELREDVSQEAPLQRLAGELVDLVVASLDLDALMAGVDVDAVLDRVDPNRLLDRVDPDRLLDRVDPNRLLDRVDPDRLLDRVDPDRLLDRVDPDRLLDRVDPDRLLDRVDVNRLVNRVDVDALIAQTELGAIVAKSTSGVVTEALDVVRSQGVGLDVVTTRWVNRLLRREPAGIPQGPAGLVRPTTSGPARPRAAAPDRDVGLQGHYAGGVTRFAAYAIDATASTAILSAGVATFGYALGMITGHDIQLSTYPVVGGMLALLWYFLWFWYPWSLSGRTLGMAVVGIRVVRGDGSSLQPRRAFVRIVTFPLSFLVFGLGFLGILTDRRRRAWHDRFADTAVVYGWDARVARLRFLAKQGAAPAA